MKTDRLIGILGVLMQEDMTTAPSLAKRFEVSRRTISRDIEALCQAGIPIQTLQGNGGGIRIMEGYKLDKALLTDKDMQMILAGLRSLDSVSKNAYYSQLMEKLKAGSSSLIRGRDSILIDLSSWSREALAPKIETILSALEDKRLVTFRYFAPSGESERMTEPYYLLFHWTSWYLWGWCCQREDLRLFKLGRMDQVQRTETTFSPREVPLPDLSAQRIFPGGIRVKALFSPEVKWRLVEEFGPSCFTETDKGLLFTAEYAHMDNLISWLLTFGDKAEVLEPTEARERMKSIIESMGKRYKEDRE